MCFVTNMKSSTRHAPRGAPALPNGHDFLPRRDKRERNDKLPNAPNEGTSRCGPAAPRV